MATVRFSAELRNDIINKAKSLFSDREMTARRNYPDTWGQTIYDLVFQDNKIAMQSLPKSYFRNSDEVSIRGFGNQEGVWSTSDNYTININ